MLPWKSKKIKEKLYALIYGIHQEYSHFLQSNIPGRVCSIRKMIKRVHHFEIDEKVFSFTCKIKKCFVFLLMEAVFSSKILRHRSLKKETMKMDH